LSSCPELKGKDLPFVRTSAQFMGSSLSDCATAEKFHIDANQDAGDNSLHCWVDGEILFEAEYQIFAASRRRSHGNCGPCSGPYPNPINHVIVIDQENRSVDNLSAAILRIISFIFRA